MKNRCFACTLVAFIIEFFGCMIFIGIFVAFCVAATLFIPKAYFLVKDDTNCGLISFTYSNTPVFAPIVDILKLQNARTCVEIAPASLYLYVDDCVNDERLFCARVYDTLSSCNNRTAKPKQQFLNIQANFKDEDDTCQMIVLKDGTVRATVFRNMQNLDDLIIFALGYIKKLF